MSQYMLTCLCLNYHWQCTATSRLAFSPCPIVIRKKHDSISLIMGTNLIQYLYFRVVQTTQEDNEQTV